MKGISGIFFSYHCTVFLGMETEVAKWRWENMAAGAIAGFTAVVSLHPLDVVRTRFQGPYLTVPEQASLIAG